jgi:hypothetical protein
MHLLVGGFPGARLARMSALALGLTCAAVAALAQSASARAQEVGTVLQVTGRDRDAASNVTARGVHTAGTGRIEGRHNGPRTFKANKAGALVEVATKGRFAAGTGPVAGAAVPALPSFTGPGFYPDDLVQNAPAGPVITDAQVHNVFVNCDVNCFARPGVFLRLLFASDFIHVLDQYTGTTQAARYSVGAAAFPQYNIQSSYLDDATDIASIVYAAATTLGTGYNHIYNVFIPQGIDVCISTSTGLQCFSPNTPANWTFCAYHSYVDFPDIGHVLYTVIPYPDQALNSGGLPMYVCDVGQTDPTSDTTPTPNGVLVDSIASFLDHELSEVITDPDLNAYQVQNSLADYLSEIGDVCVNPAFLYTPFAVSGSLYYIQPEYSNTYHACATVP